MMTELMFATSLTIKAVFIDRFNCSSNKSQFIKAEIDLPLLQLQIQTRVNFGTSYINLVQDALITAIYEQEQG